jgi:hypothetical protein
MIIPIPLRMCVIHRFICIPQASHLVADDIRMEVTIFCLKNILSPHEGSDNNYLVGQYLSIPHMGSLKMCLKKDDFMQKESTKSGKNFECVIRLSFFGECQNVTIVNVLDVFSVLDCRYKQMKYMQILQKGGNDKPYCLVYCKQIK